MPDDDRHRRRLGDETKGRIADLASGWSVDPVVPAAVVPPTPPTPPAPPAPPTSTAASTPDPEPRKKPKTQPPPAPGSAARRAADKEKETSVSLLPAAAGTLRTSSPTTPPAVPPGAVVRAPVTPGHQSGPVPSMPMPAAASRSKPMTAPPPIPAAARTKPPTQQMPVLPPVPAPVTPLVIEASGPRLPRAEAVIVDERTVPIGEFDQVSTNLEPDKLRIAHSQATIKRDAASSLLGIAEAPLTVVKPTPPEVLLTESAEHGRGDPTSIDPQTQRFERGDPTQLGRPDITLGSTPPAGVHTAAGRLRTVAALRRQRGIFGDVRYVATAVFGARNARKEIAELEATQAQRQQERRRHLITLGRTAVISDGFDHPALGAAREQLGGVEDERARHTGQVAAADQELDRVRRDRDAHAKQYVIDLAAVDAELAELTRRYEPLIKEQASVTKRGAELRESLRRLDAKIAETLAQLVSVKGPRQDPAAIQAELATLKADRIAVQRDEPVIAAELDALNPRIAALEAKRSDSQKRRAELVETEANDKRRTEELLEAIGAKRKVMDRAASDAEALRDKILFELGERLNVDRPESLAAQLAPLDAIDVELGTVERRMMELREILSSIDKAKLARGIAVIVLTLAAVGVLAWWLIYMLA